MPQPTPILADLLDYAIDDRLADVEVAFPGRVESYDDATQTAAVQPLVQRVFYDEQQNRQTERLPVIHDVPVCFQGAGACTITFPVPKGTTVLVVVASASLDRWLARGGEVDPGDERRHNLSDAIAIPGLRSRKDAIKGSSGGPPPSDGICITAPKIYLGGDDATDPVARKSDLQALADDIKGHTHPGVTTGPDPTGASAELTSLSAPDCSPVVRSK